MAYYFIKVKGEIVANAEEALCAKLGLLWIGTIYW